jgi:hypothetical protein
MPVLKLGMKLAGRKRVVGLLSGLVAKLIGWFVGPQSSGALSTAMVDAGLKLIGLEVSDGDQRRAANAAIAATVEETVRRVAACRTRCSTTKRCSKARSCAASRGRRRSAAARPARFGLSASPRLIETDSHPRHLDRVPAARKKPLQEVHPRDPHAHHAALGDDRRRSARRRSRSICRSSSASSRRSSRRRCTSESLRNAAGEVARLEATAMARPRWRSSIR